MHIYSKAGSLNRLLLKVRYLHSDIDTVERVEILRDLRLGTFDVVVGINLLREGLDLPEVSLVAVLHRKRPSASKNSWSATRRTSGTKRRRRYATSCTFSSSRRSARRGPTTSRPLLLYRYWCSELWESWFLKSVTKPAFARHNRCLSLAYAMIDWLRLNLSILFFRNSSRIASPNGLNR